ncbi:MAG: rRNA maturation RNase YbeY [Patescibacteria group bacterium]
MIDVTMSGALPAGLTRRDLERAIRLTFVRTRHAVRGSVALAFVSSRRMRALNKSWRHKDRTTDVLSFAPAIVPSDRGPKDWGDILVEPSFVRAEARRRGIPFAEEVLRVTVHGMLHLFGYDHATEPDELKMFTLQERIVAEAL